MPSTQPSIEDIQTSVRAGAGPLTQQHAADVIDGLQLRVSKLESNDRLEQCKQRLQWKLENAIEHVASLAKHIKRATPNQVQGLCIEMRDLQIEIADLRNALHYMADFEVEASDEARQAS